MEGEGWGRVVGDAEGSPDLVHAAEPPASSQVILEETDGDTSD
jgi:hypothetical protein